MNSNKSKQILIAIILAVSFLIEFPLRTTIHSILALSQPLAYLITSIIFYVALFACFIISLKPDITSKSVIKSIGIVIGFFVLEQIISAFLFSEIIALVYEIIRPLLIAVVVLLGYRLILKSKIRISKLFLVVLGVLLVSGAVFSILEYVRIITSVQNMGTDFFSYLSLLDHPTSIYAVLTKLCTYIFTFVLFAQSKDLTGDAKD